MENEISEKELENLINNCSIIKGLSHYNNKNQNKKNRYTQKKYKKINPNKNN